MSHHKLLSDTVGASHLVLGCKASSSSHCPTGHWCSSGPIHHGFFTALIFTWHYSISLTTLSTLFPILKVEGP